MNLTVNSPIQYIALKTVHARFLASRDAAVGRTCPPDVDPIIFGAVVDAFEYTLGEIEKALKTWEDANNIEV
jgi:hypothetical protein